MAEFIVVIPARYGSSRLPAKPLRDIAGKTMIERVYQQAMQSKASRVVIATDDQRIVDALKHLDVEVCMTRADHESGTDRLQEVCQQLQLKEQQIVVNVQGDEPLIPPEVINQVAELLAPHDDIRMATLAEPIVAIEAITNPNVVKVVSDAMQQALYFSRASIPFDRDSAVSDIASIYRRHIGIYAYRVSLLNQFVSWPLGRLESIEKLEQLRVLENGDRILVADACADVPGGVDTEADLQTVIDLVVASQ